MPPPIDLKIQVNVPLAPLTTFKIGGPASYFVNVETEGDVCEAFEIADTQGLDVFVLGGGSNILVSDEGFDGLVIYVDLKGVKREGSTIVAAAGEDWDKLVEYCVSAGLAGFECLSGIPGSVGGTPVQNVGAYGQEVSETIDSVRCFDRLTNSIVELKSAECGFSYRKSIFNTSDRDRYVVLRVDYRLAEGGRPKIAYKDLKEHFGGRVPTLLDTRQAVLQIRRAKSMVIDEDDPNSRSAGSFFKNPVISMENLGLITAAAGVEAVPHYPADDGMAKVPAAWLIENAGFSKGYRLGNAGISANHSLALINVGGAKAAEIVALKQQIQAKVSEKFNIELIPEPIFVGRF